MIIVTLPKPVKQRNRNDRERDKKKRREKLIVVKLRDKTEMGETLAKLQRGGKSH